MVEIIIGVFIIASFIGMIIYCVKGFNLMVGFFLIASVWTGLAMLGNAISPIADGPMAERTWIQVLAHVYQAGPQGFAQNILVFIFFGAFFGRVLMDTGIAGTLIRKVVELGGDRPRITMILLCIVTSLCFTAMTGIGPVISIAVIVLPIMQSLGIAAPIALFAFMGSIMAGIAANITNFQQYHGILSGAAANTINDGLLENYTYNDYAAFGWTALILCLVITMLMANLALNKNKPTRAWAAPAEDTETQVNAPWYSWIAVVLPVILVITLSFPIIPAFILSAIFALLTCRKLTGGFTEVCRMLAKQFIDGAVDVAPMVGFLLTLSMFNNSALFASPYFSAIVGNIFPTTPLMIAILFAVIMPLGFFRGPTNLVGCGVAIAVVVMTIAPWNAMFIYPIFAMATIVPQHIDITQSWVAWGLGYTKVGSKDFMKFSIPTGWVAGAILCIIAFFMFGSIT